MSLAAGMYDRLERYAAPKLGRPVVVMVLFVIAISAALLGENKGEILHAFPFCCWRTRAAAVSWPAVLFWTSTLLTGLGDHLKDRKKEWDMADLRLDVRTMPPPDLLTAFDFFFRRAHATQVSVLLDEASTLAPEDGARFILWCLANLVRKCNGSSEDVMFSANVMLHVPKKRFGQAPYDKLEERLRFLPAAPGDIEGALDLRCDFAVRTSGQNMVPDSTFSPFALPLVARVSQGAMVLPGAPQAFRTGEVDLVPDIEALVVRCAAVGLPTPVVDEVRNYFASEVPSIRSFITFPLARSRSSADPAATPDNSLGEIVGVVNVNCGRPRLLWGRDGSHDEAEMKRRVQWLYYTARPLLWLLPELLEKCGMELAPAESV